MTIELNNPKTLKAWYMYDWANSVYSLVITSAIFPVYYQAVAVTKTGSDVISFFGYPIVNSVLYSWSLSASFLVMALILPLLSGMADYTGRKKFFMKIFVYIGGLACMGLYFFKDVETVELAIVFSMLASIGYAGSLVFYDAYLPEIASSDRYDRTSANGYSWGYYGSIILLIFNLVQITFYDSFGFATAGEATRFSFLLVGLWWVGFSQIPFAVLPENPFGRKPKLSALIGGYWEILKVWNELKTQTNIRLYLVAYFFFNMGVQTVMYLAATFGSKELELADEKLIMTVLIIQVVAAFGAYGFARLSEKRGNKLSLMTMIAIWIGVCLSAYFVYTEYQFYALAFTVGLVMGGIQSLSRATYSKIIPSDTVDHASYFSFFDVTFNLSIVMGTFSYGLIEQITGNMRNSTLVLMVFFIIGMFLLSRVKIKSIRLGNQ
ncbi:MAG: MFS transporter [Cyclobacteriaceae bacterium]|nr:MFS transporter [Cyclobacteriaceae bacterium]